MSRTPKKTRWVLKITIGLMTEDPDDDTAEFETNDIIFDEIICTEEEINQIIEKALNSDKFVLEFPKKYSVHKYCVPNLTVVDITVLRQDKYDKEQIEIQIKDILE